MVLVCCSPNDTTYDNHEYKFYVLISNNSGNTGGLKIIHVPHRLPREPFAQVPDFKTLDNIGGRVIFNIVTHYLVMAIDFSPKSEFVIAAGLGTGANGMYVNGIFKYSVSTMEPVAYYDPGGGVQTRSISYSPDGKYVASVSTDSTIRIWNALSDDGNPLHIVSQNDALYLSLIHI